MDLEYVKNYLRVCTDEDDLLISNLINTSISYLQGAVDDFDEKIKNEKFKNIADLVICAMVSEMYDNRVFVKNDRYDKVSYMTRSMINHLQYWGDSDEY